MRSVRAAVEQQADQRPSRLLHRAGDGRQRRVAEVGAEDVVVAHHRHRPGHGDAALLQPAQHADRHQVVERHQRGGARGQPDVGGRRPRPRASAGTGRAGRSPPPPRGSARASAAHRSFVGPRVARAAEVGQRAVAQRDQVLDDLAAAVVLVADHAREARELPVVQRERAAARRSSTSSSSGRRLDASTNPSTDEPSRAGELGLQLRAAPAVGEHQRVARRRPPGPRPRGSARTGAGW